MEEPQKSQTSRSLGSTVTAVSMPVPVVDGGRTSTRLVVGSPLRVERAEDACSRPILRLVDSQQPVRSVELSLMGQELVADMGKRGVPTERHQQAKRLVVDDFGDAVAVQHRCWSCKGDWGVRFRPGCPDCQRFALKKRRRDDVEGYRARARAARLRRIERDPKEKDRERDRARRARKARRETDLERERALERAWTARYLERLRKDPVRYQRRLEQMRIDGRARRAEAGATTKVRPEPVGGSTAGQSHRYVLAAPLVALVRWLNRNGELEDLAEEAGVSERLLRAWRNGERRYATWHAVDAVLVASERLWWDVYDPVVARPCETFSGVRGRDVVSWINAAERAIALWEPQPAIGDRMSINRNTWRVESWDEGGGVFWLRRVIDGERASFKPERLEELL